MTLRGLATTVAALVLAACGPGAATAVSPAELPAPEVVDLARITAEATAPGGSGLVLNFWATWCAPCLQEMPDLARLTAEVEPQGLRVRAVSIDLAMPIDYDTVEAVTAFASEYPIEVPVWIFDGDLEALSEALDLPGPVPYTVVFDAAGNVTASHNGMSDLAGLREMARTALD